MNRRRLGGIAVVAVALLAAAVGVPLFLPESSTSVDEPVGASDAADRKVLASGTFTGKAGHTVAGQVSLVEDADGYLLRFEDYGQTPGPDVYIYLTPSADPDTASEINAGEKILIDGGADGGESTKVGTFEQRLPADFDPSGYHGVAVWCDRFATPFGTAPLEPVSS